MNTKQEQGSRTLNDWTSPWAQNARDFAVSLLWPLAFSFELDDFKAILSPMFYARNRSRCRPVRLSSEMAYKGIESGTDHFCTICMSRWVAGQRQCPRDGARTIDAKSALREVHTWGHASASRHFLAQCSFVSAISWRHLRLPAEMQRFKSKAFDYQQKCNLGLPSRFASASF